MNTEPNRPTGHYEMLHRIEPGDTISKVANHYRARGWPVGGWEPIWKVNTDVYENLRDRKNPDLIYPGDVLIIPRSPAGYDAVLQRLAATLAEFGQLVTDVQAGLRNIKKEGDRYGDRIDLTATVATLGAGLALKGASLAKLASDGQKLSGTALAANRYLMKSAAQDMSNDVAKFARDQALEAIDSRLGTANKALKSVQDARKIRTTFRIDTVLDVTGIILDWVNPSTIAKAIVGYDKTLTEQERLAENTRAKVTERMCSQMLRITEAKRKVYPAGS